MGPIFWAYFPVFGILMHTLKPHIHAHTDTDTLYTDSHRDTNTHGSNWK